MTKQEKKLQEAKGHENGPITQPEISSHLLSLTQAMVQAINTRIFDPSSPPWTSLSPSFRASPHPPNAPLNVDRVEWLQFMADLYGEFPEWKMRCTEATFYAGEDGGKGGLGTTAEVFMNLETSGIPPGIVTRSCAVVKFRELKAGWRCVGFLGVNGGPGLEGEGG